MKHIFPVFLALILVFSLICVPALAIDSFIFEFPENSEDGVAFGPALPDGFYNIKFTLSGGILPDPYILFSDSPVSLSFDFVEDESDGPYYFCETSFPLTSDLTGTSGNFTLVVASQGSSGFLRLYEGSTSVSPVLLGAANCSVTFIPVTSCGSLAPSLSGIVDSGMMSGVLDQVVSLLPVLIVSIVTFIATRKGIAFLRGFLAGS